MKQKKDQNKLWNSSWTSNSPDSHFAFSLFVEERFNQYSRTFKFQSHSNDLAPTTVEHRNKTSPLDCMCNCLLLQGLLLSLSKIKSFNYAGSSVPAPICLTATASGWHFFWREKLTFCSRVICSRLPVNRSAPCEQGDTPQALWSKRCGHSLLVSNCYLNETIWKVEVEICCWWEKKCKSSEHDMWLYLLCTYFNDKGRGACQTEEMTVRNARQQMALAHSAARAAQRNDWVEERIQARASSIQTGTGGTLLNARCVLLLTVGVWFLPDAHPDSYLAWGDFFLCCRQVASGFILMGEHRINVCFSGFMYSAWELQRSHMLSPDIEPTRLL